MFNSEQLATAKANYEEGHAETVKSLNRASSMLLLYAIDEQKEPLEKLVNNIKDTMPVLEGVERALAIGVQMNMPERLRLESLDIINYSKLVITLGDLLMNYKPKRILSRLKEMRKMNKEGKPEMTKEVHHMIDKVLSGLIGIYERN